MSIGICKVNLLVNIVWHIGEYNKFMRRLSMKRNQKQNSNHIFQTIFSIDESFAHSMSPYNSILLSLNGRMTFLSIAGLRQFQTFNVLKKVLMASNCISKLYIFQRSNRISKLGRHSLYLNMFLVKYFCGNFFENELFPHIFLFNHFSIHTILNTKEEIYLETETPRLLSNEANDKNLI